MRFYFDCHVHTGRSFCGRPEMTPEALVRLMKQRGLKGFAITDHSSHFYFDSTEEIWDSRSPRFFLRNSHVVERNHSKAEKAIREHISSIRRYARNRVLVGLEADCDFEGNLIVPPGIRKELNILIGSIHWLPCAVEGDEGSKQCIREFLDVTLKLLEKGIHVLAHPTRIFTWNGMEVPREVVDPLIDVAIANGVALELNSHSKDPDDYFIQRCIEKGAMIAMGTDAHSLEEFGDFSYHTKILTECDATVIISGYGEAL